MGENEFLVTQKQNEELEQLARKAVARELQTIATKTSCLKCKHFNGMAPEVLAEAFESDDGIAVVYVSSFFVSINGTCRRFPPSVARGEAWGFPVVAAECLCGEFCETESANVVEERIQRFTEDAEWYDKHSYFDGDEFSQRIFVPDEDEYRESDANVSGVYWEGESYGNPG